VFNVGPEKLILLFVIALIVLGPSRLPDAARTMGRALAELRRISGSLQSEVREALNDPKDALTAAVADVRNELGSVRNELGSVREGLGGVGLSGGVGASAEPTTWSPPEASQPLPVPPSPDDPSLN
jgi:Tat protein translocase TatB subunit